MELDLEVQRLRVLESQYRADKYSMEDNILKILPSKLAGLTASAKVLEADIARRDAQTPGEFYMRLGKLEYTERKDAGEMLLKVFDSEKYADKVIGYYRGFEIIPHAKVYLTDLPQITLKGEMSYLLELSNSELGCIARIENGLNGLDARLLEKKKEIAETERRLEASKIQLQRPFEREEALQMSLSELESVNAELDVNKSGDADALIDENNADTEDILGLDEEAGDEDGPEM